MSRRLALILALATALPAAGLAAETPRVVVGAKKFTESAILGELMAQVLEAHAGATVERRFNLAGTQVCYDGLRTGAIDVYAEYTGTALRSILGATDAPATAAAVFAEVSETFRTRDGLVWLAPFGFDNTYVLLMRPPRAAALGVRALSDLAAHPLRYGMSHEFLARPDGMPGLRAVYRLNEAQTVGIEHDLAYQALIDGDIDVADGYATDAKIAALDLLPLVDDRAFFPPYQAAPFARADLFTRLPAAEAALRLLAGRIDAATMRRLNAAVEVERRAPEEVAASFLRDLGLASREVAVTRRATTLAGVLWDRRAITAQLTVQHLLLTGAALLGAILVGLPLGVAASRRPLLAGVALSSAGVLQTIPSIALLAFMLPLFGIGTAPAIAALFLYGLLPILRNTVAGLRSVDPLLLEVGRGLGMRARDLLWQVELPLAAPVILAGIRTAAVISVGTATLAAFIGAGGLGDPIVTGLSVTDINLVLSGALPAALLAIAVDLALHAVERLATPKGLRVAG
ncbi:MAG TPA: glycine betaine ABC transporter substrate-binding protein [Candidatus Dormibacteraeota bacterium]|nr:glycine betaine ABC transporter substrate-binding protein [Candidatus Dormibacteraeota bacterium]